MPSSGNKIISDASRRASIAANVKWAYAEAYEGTRAAREASPAGFGREVDLQGRLATNERGARATRLGRAHFAELSRSSAAARRDRSVAP